MDVLGIDFGGSGIKGAIVNTQSGELVTERHRIVTPKPATPRAVTSVIIELIKHFKWKGNVGIGVPAVVKNGVVLTATNIHKSWIGYAANEKLSKETNCAVTCINDADAAGIAEVHFGAGAKENGLIILLTIGTGIGSVIVNKKQLLPNMELGHLQFKKQIVEDYIADRVRKKEELSWEKWGKRFNQVLAYYEKIFSPNLFIIGGGVSKKMEKFEKQIKVETTVVPAEMKNNAGIIGAAKNASGKS